MVQSNGNGNGNRNVNPDDIDVYESIAPEEWFKYNLGTGERDIVFDEQLPDELRREDDEESDPSN